IRIGESFNYKGELPTSLEFINVRLFRRRVSFHHLDKLNTLQICKCKFKIDRLPPNLGKLMIRIFPYKLMKLLPSLYLLKLREYHKYPLDLSYTNITTFVLKDSFDIPIEYGKIKFPKSLKKLKLPRN